MTINDSYTLRNPIISDSVFQKPQRIISDSYTQRSAIISDSVLTQFLMLNAPANQPTLLTFTNVTATSFDVSFTASVGGADVYLAIRRTSASPTYVPVDGTTYSVGQSVGDGEVRHFGAGVSFSESGLTASTNYFYDIFAVNGGAGTYNYLTTSPLENSQRTLFDFGNCLRFDTVNDIVTHTVTNFLGGRNQFIWAGWVIFDETLGAVHVLWEEFGVSNNRCRLFLHTAPGTWRFDAQAGSNVYRTFTWVPTVGVKYHVGLKYDGAVFGVEKARMLVDGVDLPTGGQNIANAIGITNVALQYSSGTLAFRANEWAWWSDADVNHILNHYNSGSGAEPDATNLIKHNKFNVVNPSTVMVDETGTDNGTLVNFNFNAASGWEAWP